ncbi:MAG: radical SAM protein [Candidatus Omnitrophota bacterium]
MNMMLLNKLSLGLKTVKARLTNERIPLVVSFAVTYRCNRHCQYCNWPTADCEELSFHQAKEVLDKLVILGVKRLQFTGGEPFLRKDMAELISHAKNKNINIFVCVNSNGKGVPEALERIKAVDMVCLSIEGPEEVHDAIRGKGSYQEVICAAQAVRKNKIRLKFTSTLNKLNISSVEYLLGFARRFDTKVSFQILDTYCLGSKQENPLLPNSLEVKRVLQDLLRFKGDPDYGRFIGNSRIGLLNLQGRKAQSFSRCASGRVLFRVTPNGYMYPCAAATFKGSGLENYAIDLAHTDVKEVKDKLRAFHYTDLSCRCACTNRIEVNLLWNFNIGSLIDIIGL